MLPPKGRLLGMSKRNSYCAVDYDTELTTAVVGTEKAYELLDDNVLTVRIAFCNRHAEVMFQPSTQNAESMSSRSGSTWNATLTSAKAVRHVVLTGGTTA